MRAVLGAVCAAALAAPLVLAPAAPAQAAPALVSSSPSAGARVTSWPDRVTLRFTDRVERGTALLRVDGPDGAVASTGRTAVSGRIVNQPLRGGLAPGRYVVRWTVLTVDGTQLAGTIPFGFRADAGPVTVARTVATVSDPAARRSSPVTGAVLVGLVVILAIWGLRRLVAVFRR